MNGMKQRNPSTKEDVKIDSPDHVYGGMQNFLTTSEDRRSITLEQYARSRI